MEDIGQNEELEGGELYFFTEEKYIQEHPEHFDEQRLTLLRKTP